MKDTVGRIKVVATAISQELDEQKRTSA